MVNLWRFAAHRVVDIFVPGAGIVMDAMDAIELIDELVSTGELAPSDAFELKDAVESMREQGKQIEAELITKKVRKCGICRQPGHDRRTCPQN
ncbi:hypothetical protein HYH03_004563 [Edaphochlamys debaryana]|uniref:CCHC-type domain-containing protein n=1 Tax=Edaphochlamys debaryana TaxID=47281 RepID=A0A835Y9U8_9CHLO|nr:hypothetical protein HYH03_004563 [Edaphochlamys debaryana]|eukprot:KAG2497408.1 hypothetical protein HYH03_004563 [Edaphochlamys debaryana]